MEIEQLLKLLEGKRKPFKESYYYYFKHSNE